MLLPFCPFFLSDAQAKLLLRMLAYMSESIKDAFMVDELRARIAQMLGYFLDHLVGRKSKDLKVCHGRSTICATLCFVCGVLPLNMGALCLFPAR